MTTGTDFIWFSVGAGNNALDQADYAASPITSGGFQSGIVLSAPFNKALRQGSAGSAALGLFVYDNTGNYQADDGNTQGFANNIGSAVHAIAVGAGAGGGVSSFNTRTGAITLSSVDVTGALTYTPAHSGANADITQLSGLTTPLSTFQGGTGNNSGNAPTASKWAAPATLSFTGDATGSGAVDGSASVSFALTLASTGVTPGTYLGANVTVDAKGRVTAISRGGLVTYGTFSSSTGPWGTWNPSTGETKAWGVNTGAITTEGVYNANFPMNIGTFQWAIAQAGNSGSSNQGSCVMQTVQGSGSGTSVSFYANDSQGSGTATADGFFWEARGYSSTQP